MRALVYRKKGTARDVLEVVERPIAEVGKGEVRVRIHASGVNPSDVKMRGGGGNNTAAMPFPEIIPHSDGAGVIDAIADDVGGLAVGERVYIFNGGWQRAYGTAAEYIVLPARQVVPLPDHVSFEHGACLGIPAMTAAYAVSRCADIENAAVLISGGGGVVGRYAVEMAKASGARHVVATASSETSRQVARDAGASVVLDYKNSNLARDAFEICQGFDHAIESEFGLNADFLSDVMRPGGMIVAYGSAAMLRPEIPFYPLMFKNITLAMMLVYLLDDKNRAQVITLIDHYLVNNLIHENIARVLTLDDAAEAHELVEGGHKSGSVVITI